MKKTTSCLICASARMYYASSVKSYRLLGCQDCGFLTIFPQPSDEELAQLRLDENSQDRREDGSRFLAFKQAVALKHLELIGRYRGRTGGRLLEVGCGEGSLLAAAKSIGYDVTGVESDQQLCAQARTLLNNQAPIIQGDVAVLTDRTAWFDVCVLSDVVEHVRDPRALLDQVHDLLAPGGSLFIATPTLDSRPARFAKKKGTEFTAERLNYFDQNTLHSLLFQCGFERTVPCNGVDAVSLNSMLKQISQPPQSPSALPMDFMADGMIAIASKKPRRSTRTVSIVIPAYNEVSTLKEVLDGVLAHELDGLEKEIILVESNSTDGTREVAQQFANHPQVRLILEDRPRGKGHAVRTGLANITGDFVMIQDADMEYDLEDYDVLLEPLMTGRKAFILGSRHGGKIWKLRYFKGNQLTSGVLNLGHWFFKTLVNVMFGLKLGDPFTMYKVFRRDCLTGLQLECNRFDLDYELVIKLVRKGYIPVEIPVNYRSRSFSEGKKVSMFRDPLTWLRAIIKFRLQPLDLFQVNDNLSPAPIPDIAAKAQSLDLSH